MTQDADREVVARRWQDAADGEHYASDRWKSPRARGRDAELVRRLMSRMDSPPSSVLDVPCGAARLRKSTRQGAAGARWCGVDVSGPMLRAAAAPSGELVRGSADALPLRDRSFDLVVCCRLLHHFEKHESRAAVVRELTRVSERYVIASYWDAASYGAWRRRTRSPLRRRRPAGGRRAIEFDELAQAFDTSGFRIVSRAFSLRFVSQQSFVLAARRRGQAEGG